MVICLERGADLHMAQLVPLPLTVSCFSKIQIGFSFLVPAHPGSPGQRAVKRVCVCVCVWYTERRPPASRRGLVPCFLGYSGAARARSDCMHASVSSSNRISQHRRAPVADHATAPSELL